MSGRVPSSCGIEAYTPMRFPGVSQNVEAMNRATACAARWRSARGSARRAASCSIRREDLVATRRKEKSATRKCRCKPLLSNQSNKVGPALTFKAFRQGRTCTMLSESVGPGRLHYGREVTRLTVEHHRQRPMTLLQLTCRNATQVLIVHVRRRFGGVFRCGRQAFQRSSWRVR
jgi:hypothetical protein